MERKYLSFRTNIADGEEIVYVSGKLYEVTFEDDENYYTGKHEETGISKSWDGIKYSVLLESSLYKNISQV